MRPFGTPIAENPDDNISTAIRRAIVLNPRRLTIDDNVEKKVLTLFMNPFISSQADIIPDEVLFADVTVSVQPVKSRTISIRRSGTRSAEANS